MSPSLLLLVSWVHQAQAAGEPGAPRKRGWGSVLAGNTPLPGGRSVGKLLGCSILKFHINLPEQFWADVRSEFMVQLPKEFYPHQHVTKNTFARS